MSAPVVNAPVDIDAVELISVRPSGDGRRLTVRVRDREGLTRRMTLPAAWLDSLATALPWTRHGNEAPALSSWSMEAASGGALLLTLRTPEGEAFSFTIKPWQIAGMATLATHGGLDRNETRSMH
jgi:hypothetical protein